MIIASTNAIIQPITMMVELVTASVAGAAVFRVALDYQMADVTIVVNNFFEFIYFLVVSCVLSLVIYGWVCRVRSHS